VSLPKEGGRPTRYRHYEALAEQAREGLAALGIPTVIPPQESSVVLRSYRFTARTDILAAA